jgi:hypothetical protein
MRPPLTEQSIGEITVLLTLSRIKEVADHAGHSQPQHQLSQCTPSELAPSKDSLNKRLLIAHTPTTMAAKVVCMTEHGQISNNSVDSNLNNPIHIPKVKEAADSTDKLSPHQLATEWSHQTTQSKLRLHSLTGQSQLLFQLVTMSSKVTEVVLSVAALDAQLKSITQSLLLDGAMKDKTTSS